MDSNTPLSNRDTIPASFSSRFDRDLSHYIDTTVYRNYGVRVIVVYEGQGNEDGNCSHSGVCQSVLRSLKMLEKGWEIRIFNSKILRQFYPHWNHPKYLVDEMLAATFHIILCQGIHCGMVKTWHTNDCVQELKRLEFHPGFPSGNKVRCPAFTGDKMNYLLGAPLHTLPSFMVELNRSDAYYSDMYPRANRFVHCSLRLITSVHYDQQLASNVRNSRTQLHGR